MTARRYDDLNNQYSAGATVNATIAKTPMIVITIQTARNFFW